MSSNLNFEVNFQFTKQLLILVCMENVAHTQLTIKPADYKVSRIDTDS